MTRGRTAGRITPSGFFVLRTPLLPFSELAAWGQDLEATAQLGAPALEDALARDRARLRERLEQAVSRPELRDAIFIASPGLDEAFDVWRKDPDGDGGRRIEPALVAYFSRAAARPTPFGLFAGCTTGDVGNRTRLRLEGRDRYRRHTRLDMDYLWTLAEAVERDPRLRSDLVYRPSSSLYEVGGRLHLAEARLTGTTRSYGLVAVDNTPYLAATLERAQAGARLDVLAAALVDDEITQADADEYLAELVQSQILVSDVRPQVTGDQPADALAATLRQHAGTLHLAERLDEARAGLHAIDAGGPGASPDRYRAVGALLEALPAEPELSRLVQVDMLKPAQEVTLGANVISEIVRGVRILHQLTRARPPQGLARFREEFAERYGTREVPLAEALDEESGIGFERSEAPSADAAPLLAGLPLGGRHQEAPPWTARESMLLRKLTEALASGSRQITIEPSDAEALDADGTPPLPDAFEVLASVGAESEDAIGRGAFRVLVQSASGPSGARLLGRFCHLDETLHQLVRAHLRAEEACRPDRVFAEIVHLPEGRVGNILSRPVLRDFEIPYLGRSGAPADRQIPVSDLLVSVQGDRIVLRSRRLGREIVPRLTTAHNYGWRSLGFYRFLCALQHQDVVPGVTWDWGPLQQAPFLPRVVSGRAVLSRARWNLSRAELAPFRESRGSIQFAAVQSWRARHALPRYVTLADADAELVVDLDNILSIEALAHQVKQRSQATLVEMFPSDGDLCVSGPEGHFLHQVVVPLIRSPEPRHVETTAPMETPVRLPGPGGVRRFPPGSEWLYLKLYSGPATADDVLHHIGEAVESSLESGAADRWFFIRYADPDPHLRIRVHGQAARLHGEVLPRLHSTAAQLLEDGRVWRIQLDTYEREVERYGGDRGIELAEQVFHADSEAVLSIVRQLSGDAGAALRWRLAVRGIDLLFDDLGLTLEQKRSIARRARTGYGQELGVDGSFQRRVSRRFREERRSLEALLDPFQDPHAEVPPGLKALRRRSVVLAPVAAELRHLAHTGRLPVGLTDVAMSYAHMHVNRLLRSAQRAQELVVYELLDRVYSSRAARSAP